MHLHGCLSYVCTRGRRKEAKSFHTFVEYLEASIYKLYWAEGKKKIDSANKSINLKIHNIFPMIIFCATL